MTASRSTPTQCSRTDLAALRHRLVAAGRRRRQQASQPRQAVLPAIVMGVDPGLARTGIGVIRHARGSFERIHSDVIRTDPDMPTAARLARIAAAVGKCAAEHRPAAAAVERVFVNINPHTSMQLGQARGAVLAALGGLEVPVAEISPNAVKRNIAGDSNADKRTVAAAVRTLFAVPPRERLPADAADALAIAAAYRSTARLRLRRSRKR